MNKKKYRRNNNYYYYLKDKIDNILVILFADFVQFSIFFVAIPVFLYTCNTIGKIEE